MTEFQTDPPVTFLDLALLPELLGALSSLGYEEPTPIQQAAIPVLLAGRDVLGQAATGTGKTAAFALPILQRRGVGDRWRDPMALILVPTRELAMQVSEALHRYGRELGVRVVPIYGGQPIGRQLRALEAGVDAVVATPGRALDHLHRGTLRLSEVQMVVLDEADEMLDMGFAEDIDAIFAKVPTSRQTILFSATIPARIGAIARRYMSDPVQIRITEESAADGETPLVRHQAYVVQRAQKAAALGRILDAEAPTAALVFCRTREAVDTLTETLNGRNYRAEALHGGMSQEQRDLVMGRLRSGTVELIVATDVAARGLDIERLSHVANYDVPSSVESYVHRIGRVGRAGREGVAITLVEPREHRMLKTIERVTKRHITVQKVPTVAEVRARRLDLTRALIRETVLEDDLDGVRVVVESLADEFDVMEIALAAVKIAHAATAGSDDDDVDIPNVAVAAPSTGRDAPRSRTPRSPYSSSEGTTRLYISVGREAGVRPQDLVGAITGETHVSGSDIGAIEISQRFSLVEVPQAAAEDVIQALRGSKIRGRRATVRRERF